MRTAIAKKLYETYCAAVGGKAHNGDALPTWGEFVADEKKKVQSEAWLALGDVVQSQIKTSTDICFLALEAHYQKLSLSAGDILLATIPKEVGLTPGLIESLSKTFTNLLHDKGVRVLIKNADIGVEVLADRLTADDLARLAQRMERKQLASPVPPLQSAVLNGIERVEVVLNGRPALCTREISYEDLLEVAGHDPKRILSVTYYLRGKGDHERSGMLTPGKKILVDAGMVFSVADTSNA